MCASTVTPPPPPSRAQKLTLDEKIGQMFVYAAHGVFTNEQSQLYRDLVHQVRDNRVGGIIWFVSDVYETAFLTSRLQREAKIPLLVSADLEMGVGMRFNDTT
ncbi:MAG: glycoside hydrolase family 3 N-terminal domain-containing protein, partial [Thermoanaerobaculia bacterium]